MIDRTVLHGGAQRLPVRLANEVEPPQKVSRYVIAPGDRCSRHVHAGKAETWLIVAGRGVAHLDDRRIEVAEGDMLVTPPGTSHALDNTGTMPLVFVNIVSPTGGPITTTELETP